MCYTGTTGLFARWSQGCRVKTFISKHYVALSFLAYMKTKNPITGVHLIITVEVPDSASAYKSPLFDILDTDLSAIFQARR